MLGISQMPCYILYRGLAGGGMQLRKLSNGALLAPCSQLETLFRLGEVLRALYFFLPSPLPRNVPLGPRLLSLHTFSPHKCTWGISAWSVSLPHYRENQNCPCSHKKSLIARSFASWFWQGLYSPKHMERETIRRPTKFQHKRHSTTKILHHSAYTIPRIQALLMGYGLSTTSPPSSRTN